MTHDEAFALMMDALDGLLDPAGQQELQGHLACCTDCYAEWQALRVVDTLFVNAPMMAAPAGFGQRVVANLEQPSWRRSVGALFALGLGSVVALMIVAAPAAMTLLLAWTAYSQPALFNNLLVWLKQLVGMSGTLLDGLWTAARLFVGEIASNPAVLAWALAAAMTVGLWGHFIRLTQPVHVNNGHSAR